MLSNRDELFDEVNRVLEESRKKGYIVDEETDEGPVVWHVKADGKRFQLFPPPPLIPPRQYTSYRIPLWPFYLIIGLLFALTSSINGPIEFIAMTFLWLPIVLLKWILALSGALIILAK